MSEIDLNKIVDIFANEMPVMDVCEVFADPNFIDFKYKTKESASDSEVMFATLVNSSNVNANVDVAMKMWLNWNEIKKTQVKKFLDTYDTQAKKQIKYDLNKPHPSENVKSKLEDEEFIAFLSGLNYEVKVYKFITENIIQAGLSPNFIPLLAYGKCNLSDIYEKLINRVKDSPKNVQDLDYFFYPMHVFDNMKLNIMITGTNKTNIKPFEKVYNDPYLPVSECNSILFQCLYTLCLMEYFQIMHYDLHFGNILMEVLDTPVCLSFRFDNNSVSFKTRYIPKFYDWDRGYIKSLDQNHVLDTSFSLANHVFNGFQVNKDYYQFVCSIFTGSNTTFKQLMEPLIPDVDFKAWKYPGKEGIELDFEMSPKTSTKLRQYIDSHKDDTINMIESSMNGYYINMLSEDALRIFNDNEIMTVFGDEYGLQKFKNSENVYFFAASDGAKVTKLPGWNCQNLHTPNQSLLVNLPLIFGTEDFFTILTQNLDICGRYEISDECAYVFPSYF